MRKMTNVVIVAHPDDELIFFGGLILNSDKTYVICLTGGDNELRRNEFVSCCEKLGVTGFIFDAQDVKGSDLDTEKYTDNILSILRSIKYDRVYTHCNSNWCYSKHHINVHDWCKKYIRRNLYVATPPKIGITNKLDMSTFISKVQALSCYSSQCTTIMEYADNLVYERFVQIK